MAERMLINRGWRYLPADPAGAEVVRFDDSA